MSIDSPQKHPQIPNVSFLSRSNRTKLQQVVDDLIPASRLASINSFGRLMVGKITGNATGGGIYTGVFYPDGFFIDVGLDLDLEGSTTEVNLPCYFINSKENLQGTHNIASPYDIVGGFFVGYSKTSPPLPVLLTHSDAEALGEWTEMLHKMVAMNQDGFGWAGLHPIVE
jgi:hypothetical protein